MTPDDHDDWRDDDTVDRPRCCPVHENAWLEYDRHDRGWRCPEEDCEFLWLQPGDEEAFLASRERL